MDSPISEEMIYCNLVGNLFSRYEKMYKDQVCRFFDKYDPRKSLNKDYLLDLIIDLVMNFKVMVGEFEL